MKALPLDFNIDLANPIKEDTSTVILPSKFIAVGKVNEGDLKVYIHQNAYKEISEYSSSDISKELGSILIGDYLQSNGVTYVLISDFIEAKFTKSSSSTLTFTHETWNDIHCEHENNFPNKRIVGWQHTHPNYGVFLSSYDLFIQENFFNLDFQIAYVVDPIRKTSGFFQNQNGKVEKLSGFYIYNE